MHHYIVVLRFPLGVQRHVIQSSYRRYIIFRCPCRILEFLIKIPAFEDISVSVYGFITVNIFILDIPCVFCIELDRNDILLDCLFIDCSAADIQFQSVCIDRPYCIKINCSVLFRIFREVLILRSALVLYCSVCCLCPALECVSGTDRLCGKCHRFSVCCTDKVCR